MDPTNTIAGGRAGQPTQTRAGLRASTEPPFGLTFSNIPLINLRMEFNDTYAFLNSPEAEECLKPPARPIRVRLFIWGGMPGDPMTLLLQRATLGIEAYLSGALWHTAAVLGSLSKGLVAKLKNPVLFGSKSAVENIYHRMPAAVHPELSLRHLDQPFTNGIEPSIRRLGTPSSTESS